MTIDWRCSRSFDYIYQDVHVRLTSPTHRAVYISPTDPAAFTGVPKEQWSAFSSGRAWDPRWSPKQHPHLNDDAPRPHDPIKGAVTA